MSNITLNNDMKTLTVGRVIDAYTGVVINAGTDDEGNPLTFSAGDDTGYVLEIDNPYGSQLIADSILSSLKMRNVSYKPYEADSALVDPAIEIGDSITANDVDSIVVSVNTNHSPLMAADVAAPHDEELDHEFTYVSRETREFLRANSETKARFAIAEDEISAKVSKTGGDASSFGWTLTDSDWSLYSNNNRVFRATSVGVEVTGKITATSGTIGGCVIENGTLKINSANITSINASIITAGTLSVDRILDRSLTGSKVAYNTLTGGGSGSGNIGLSTITTSNTVSGINTSLGYADYANGVFSGTNTANYVGANTMVTTNFTFNGSGIGKQYLTVNGVTYCYLSWGNPF